MGLRFVRLVASVASMSEPNWRSLKRLLKFDELPSDIIAYDLDFWQAGASRRLLLRWYVA